MPAKKRGQNSGDTPFDPQTVAAITRDIPGLLAKAGYFSPKTQTSNAQSEMFDHHVPDNLPTSIPEKTIPTPVPRGDRHKMIYAVIGFSLLIGIIWFFNVRNTITNAWDNPVDPTLINQGANDFNTALETIKNNDRIVREKLEQNASLDPTTQAQLEQAIKEAVQPKPNL